MRDFYIIDDIEFYSSLLAAGCRKLHGPMDDNRAIFTYFNFAGYKCEKVHLSDYRGGMFLQCFVTIAI